MRRSLVVLVVTFACKGGNAPTAIGSGSGSGSGAVVTAGSGSGSGSGSATPVAAKPTAPAAPPFELPAPADKITAISGDTEATCVLRASGHVDCWGAWSDDPQGRVKRVAGVDDAIAVRVTKDRRCILRRKALECADEPTQSPTTILTPAGATFDEIAPSRPCARTTDGRVACWDLSPSETPLQAVPEPHLAHVAHLANACVVTDKGGVSCSLGDKWERVPHLEHVRWLAPGLQAGEEEQFQSTCAGFEDGSVRCFAITQIHGRSGLEISADSELKPEEAAALKGATAIAFDDSGVIALVGGKVLIDHDKEPIRTLPVLADAVAITPRCALRAQGSVVCWGDAGETLGQPHLANRRSDTPLPVVGIADVVSVARSKDASWAVTRDGKLYAWGKRETGTAMPVAFDGAATEVVTDQSGYGDEACVLRRDHHVLCRTAEAGFADVGLANVAELREDGGMIAARLADGTAVEWYAIKPTEHHPMHGVTGAVEVAGTFPRCYRTATAVRCTPYNCVHDAQGVCSYPDQPWADLPVKDIVELVHARDTICGRTKQGGITCWGVAAYDAGSAAPVPPQPIAGITDAVGLSVEDGMMGSDLNVCAVRADGRLTCWNPDKPEPKDVLPLHSVAPPVVGANNGCTIRDGQALCWGDDDAGQLGIGTVVHLDTPAAVPGL
ncbi:MAG TPA: hypothetical protein VLX92_22200 [Kofleriaceae bacterium]|nr:hypothetical protein [Kofleriaceae bacterium]